MSNFKFFGSVALTLLLPSVTSAQVLCFASANPPKAIRLQLSLPLEGSQVASVRYERGSKDIPLVRVVESSLTTASRGPATVKATFSELVDGQRTGEYVLTTQGGAVGDLVYVRQKDNKVYTFYEDLDATGSVGCEWAAKPDTSQ